MTPLLIFLLVLIVGFISTNFIFSRIQTRFYAPSGIEYIFLGILLGPAFANWMNTFLNIKYPLIITNDILIQLNPGISAAIGFIGLTYGLKFQFTDFQKSEPEHTRIAFFEIFISLLVIGGGSFALFYLFFYNGNNFEDIIAAAYGLSVIGGISSTYFIKTLITKYKLNGVYSSAISSSSIMNVNFNIFIYGLLFGIIHIGSNANIKITPTEWIVISILIAVVIGILFFIFLGREKDTNKLFVAVLGIALFTSGVAYFLNFSPLYMNFILGAILANLSKVSSNIEDALTRLQHPLSVLIVVMAGFIWVPPSLTIFIIAIAAYIVLRYLTKFIAGYLAYQSAYDKEKLSSGIGKGLLPHDIIACAMVIDYYNVYNNQFTPIVVSCVLVSVILFNMVGYSTTKSYLIDVGEISGEKL